MDRNKMDGWRDQLMKRVDFNQSISFLGGLCLVGPQDRPRVCRPYRRRGQAVRLRPDPGPGWRRKCESQQSCSFSHWSTSTLPITITTLFLFFFLIVLLIIQSCLYLSFLTAEVMTFEWFCYHLFICPCDSSPAVTQQRKRLLFHWMRAFIMHLINMKISNMFYLTNKCSLHRFYLFC